MLMAFCHGSSLTLPIQLPWFVSHETTLQSTSWRELVARAIDFYSAIQMVF